MDPKQDPQTPVPKDPFTNDSQNTTGPYGQPSSQTPATPSQPEPVTPQATPSEPVNEPSSSTQPQPTYSSETSRWPEIQPSQPQSPQPQQQNPYASPSSTLPTSSGTNLSQGQVYTGTPVNPVLPKNPRKKLLLAGAGGLAALVILSLGGVFAVYLPNKPENVWSAGISRTGKTVDKIVTSATNEKALASYKSSELSGSAEATVEGKTYKGSFNSKYDSKQTDNSFTYNGDGQPKDFNLKLLTDLADGKDFPDVYFQITGLSALGVDQFVPGADKYDGKWISVSSDYLKSVLPVEEKEAKNSQFTSQDAAELSRAVSNTTRDYVFSNDPAKAVLVRKNFVGTEKIEDGITANHYTVGINKDNAKKYCQALIESVVSTNGYKHIPGINPDSIDKDKQDSIKSCQSDIDTSFKDTDEFDVWIDKSKKLINKIRFTDEANKGTYVEVGQTYKKGDVVPLFLKAHSDEDKYEYTMTLETDMKKSTTKGAFNLSYTAGTNITAKAAFEFKPFDGDVTITKPTDSISIEKLLQDLDQGSSGRNAPSVQRSNNGINNTSIDL